MNKGILANTFKNARETESPFVFVELSTPAGREVIVIPSDSFDAKEKFYTEAYNANLVHVMNDKVFINGLSFGDSSELDHII